MTPVRDPGSVPPAIAQALNAALVPDRAQRFQTAQAFAAALRGAVGEAPAPQAQQPQGRQAMGMAATMAFEAPVIRCFRKCVGPSCAEPRPRARFSGVIIAMPAPIRAHWRCRATGRR